MKIAYTLSASVLICLLTLAPASPVMAVDYLHWQPNGLMIEADMYFAMREDLNQAESAAQCYRNLLTKNPNNLKVSLRLARVLVWLGAHEEGDAKLKYYKESLAVCQDAQKRHPKEPGPVYWLGVSQGLIANNSGMFTGLRMVKKVQTQMEKLLKMDPAYEYGGAYRVLGRVYAKLPRLMGGSTTKAEAYLKKAIALGPKYWINHLYLADLYQEEGREKEARALMQQVSTGSSLPGQEAESKAWRQLACQVLLDNPVKRQDDMAE